MLCPKCLKKDKESKLKVIESRPSGPFEQWRKYLCPKCEFITFQTEKLEDPACNPQKNQLLA